MPPNVRTAESPAQHRVKPIDNVPPTPKNPNKTHTLHAHGLTPQTPIPTQARSIPQFARLPRLGTIRANVSSQSSTSTNPLGPPTNASLPSFMLPDRVNSTRVLLQETQTCVQKFSTRMDGLAKGVEQHLKEVEMCKAAIEASGERAVAEMGDVVHRAQLALEKRLDSFEGMFSETNRELALQGGRLSHIQNSISLLENLFKTLQPALDSLTSFSHTHSVALQAAQEQQFKIFEVTKESQGVLDKLHAQANDTGTRVRKTRKAKEKQRAAVDVERVSPEPEEEDPSSHTSSASDSKRLHIETSDIEAAQQPNDACIHATLDGISKTSAGKKTATGIGPRPYASISGRVGTVTQRARTKTLAAASHTVGDESIAKLNALSRSLSNRPVRTLLPTSARSIISAASNAETMASGDAAAAAVGNKPASESRGVVAATINVPIELSSDATATTMRSFHPEAPQLEVDIQEKPAQQIEKENVPVPSTSSKKQTAARKDGPVVNGVANHNVQAAKGKSSKKRTSAALDPDHTPKSKKPRNSNSKAKGATAAMKKLHEVGSTSTEANQETERPGVNTKDGVNASVANQLQPEVASTTSTAPTSRRRVLLPRSSVDVVIPPPEENGDLYADSETEARVGTFLAGLNESVSGLVVRGDANANGSKPPSLTIATKNKRTLFVEGDSGIDLWFDDEDIMV